MPWPAHSIRIADHDDAPTVVRQAHLWWEAGTMAPWDPDLMVHSWGLLLVPLSVVAELARSACEQRVSIHTGRSMGDPSLARG